MAATPAACGPRKRRTASSASGFPVTLATPYVMPSCAVPRTKRANVLSPLFGPLGDVQHPLQRDAGPFGCLRVDRDAVDDVVVDEVLEDPAEMGGVDSEHRRARADERVEREHCL